MFSIFFLGLALPVTVLGEHVPPVKQSAMQSMLQPEMLQPDSGVKPSNALELSKKKERLTKASKRDLDEAREKIKEDASTKNKLATLVNDLKGKAKKLSMNAPSCDDDCQKKVKQDEKEMKKKFAEKAKSTKSNEDLYNEMVDFVNAVDDPNPAALLETDHHWQAGPQGWDREDLIYQTGDGQVQGNTHLFEFEQAMEVVRTKNPNAYQAFNSPFCRYWIAYGIHYMDEPNMKDDGSGKHFYNEAGVRWDGSSTSCKAYRNLDQCPYCNFWDSFKQTCASSDAKELADEMGAWMIKSWAGCVPFYENCYEHMTCLHTGMMMHLFTDLTMPMHSSGFSDASWPFGVHNAIEQVAPIVQSGAKCSDNTDQCYSNYNYIQSVLPSSRIMTPGQIVSALSATTNSHFRYDFFVAWYNSGCFKAYCDNDCQQACLGRDPFKAEMQKVMRVGAGSTAWAIEAIYTTINWWRTATGNTWWSFPPQKA